MRKTTSYLMLIPTSNPNQTLDEIVAESIVQIEQTAVYTGMCGVRFRCRTGDGNAKALAVEIARGREFTLRTGYGTHQRDIPL